MGHNGEAVMQKASGTIEVVARNQKAFKLEGDEEWYSVFKAVQLNGAEAGASVSFEYKDTDRGGKTYHNVQGNVETTAKAPQKAAGSSGATASVKDVTISRLSLLKTAGDLVAAVGQYEGDTQAATEDALAVAEALEAWVYRE